jgi:lysozyme family protein
MKDTYSKSLARVLVYEGGKVNHPKDPGGKTNQGVTQRVYTAYRRRNKLADNDVYDMSDAERDAIYREQYWDEVRGDELPPGVDFVVFDGAVNSGCSQSVKWLQRALGVRADGQLGMVTMQKLQSINDADLLVEAICEKRMSFLRSLKTWGTFRKGWTRRVDNVLATGQAWAWGSVGPEVVRVEGMQAKARIEDARPLPTRTPADVATGVGATLAAGTQAVTEVKDTLAPVADFGFATTILTAVTIVGVVLAIAGLAYRHYITIQKRRMSDDLGNEAD